MRRSEINAILEEGEAFFRAHGVALPPFAWMAPETLRTMAGSEIHRRRLGWDVTDYNAGRFAELGLFLFTLRNGTVEDLRAGTGMVYAEKFMITRRHQLSPMHRHVTKTEDIINRAGGTLVLELFSSDVAGRIDRQAPVTVPTDGVLRTLPAGGHLRLHPGESVTLHPGIWHAFWAEGGDVLIGEVSTVNDDLTDNIFDPPLPRFAEVSEDAPPLRLLVSDY